MGGCLHLCTPVSRVTLVVCNTGVVDYSGRVERVNIYSGCTKTYNSGTRRVGQESVQGAEVYAG